MRYSSKDSIIRAIFLIVFLALPILAQNNAQERAASLHSQLAQIQSQLAELQMRLEQLEEDLKPESIERSLAGVGSTRPEELREARRRQLEIEKKSTESQLDTLAASRTRLEAAIAQADNESYYESAGLNKTAQLQRSSFSNGRSRSNKQRMRRAKPLNRRG